MKPHSIISPLILALALAAPAALFAQGKVVPAGGKETRSSAGVATNVWTAATAKINWFTVSAYNGSGSDIYLMVFDTNTTNVVNGSVPDFEPVRIPSGSTGGWSEPQGVEFRTGLVVFSSTTPYTLTNSAASMRARVTYFP